MTNHAFFGHKWNCFSNTIGNSENLNHYLDKSGNHKTKIFENLFPSFLAFRKVYVMFFSSFELCKRWKDMKSLFRRSLSSKKVFWIFCWNFFSKIFYHFFYTVSREKYIKKIFWSHFKISKYFRGWTLAWRFGRKFSRFVIFHFPEKKTKISFFSKVRHVIFF